MILDTATKSIEIKLGEAHITNALPVTADYVDLTTTTTTAGNSDAASNGTAAVTIVAAPAASTQRKVNYLSVQNADTIAHAVTIQLNNNTTLRTIVKITLQIGDSLQFTDTNGWAVITYTGVEYALLAGSASQVFSVATATAAAHAVPKSQVESIATTAGDTAKIQSGTLTATTSGTSIDFTGIPAGTKRITFLFNGVSTNGTSNLLLQIGDAGGIETAGYAGAASQLSNAAAVVTSTMSTGFLLTPNTVAAQTRHGAVVLNLIDSATFLWSESGNISTAQGANDLSGGSKALTAELTTVRLTTVNGTDAFDAGSVNIQWEL